MASCIIRSTPTFSTLTLPDFSTSRLENMSTDHSCILDWGAGASTTSVLYPERFGVMETIAQGSSSECRIPEALLEPTRSNPVPCKIEPEGAPPLSEFSMEHEHFALSDKKLGDWFSASKQPPVAAGDQVFHNSRKSSKRSLSEVENISHCSGAKAEKRFEMNECIASSLPEVAVLGVEGSPLCSSPTKLPEPDHEVHIWTERERRKKMRSMFVTLHSMLPKVPSKADKSTIVDEAINYIKSLEQKMQRLLKKKSERVKSGAILLHSERSSGKDSLDIINNNNNNNNKNMNIQLVSGGSSSGNQSSSSFYSLASSNIVFNVCGADAFITICAGAEKRQNLLSRIFTCVIHKHKLEVKNVQITDASDNRRLLMIHACATDVTRTLEADLRNVMQELMRCI